MCLLNKIFNHSHSDPLEYLGFTVESVLVIKQGQIIILFILVQFSLILMGV